MTTSLLKYLEGYKNAGNQYSSVMTMLRTEKKSQYAQIWARKTL